MPNILITGTPGTGKTTLAKAVAEKMNWRHIDVSAFVKENELHSGYNKKWDSYEIDEEALVDALETHLLDGNCIVDTHSSSSFPLRWFSLVVCLTTSTDVLYDRLKARGYSQHKVQENVECEIMQVCLEEANEFKKSCTVEVMQSNTTDECESNLARLCQLLANL